MKFKSMLAAACLASAGVVGLSGCAGVADTLGLGGVVNTGYTVASAALMVYRDGYQAPVLVYGGLPICGTTSELVCRDPAVWAKFKAIDAKATAAIVAGDAAMKVANGDVGSITTMMAAVAAAEAEFTVLGLTPKVS